MFGNASAQSTTATFSAGGTYVLTLSANDGELSGADTVTVQVTAGLVNLPPTAERRTRSDHHVPGGRRR